MCPPIVTLAFHIIEGKTKLPFILRLGLRTPECHLCCILLIKAAINPAQIPVGASVVVHGLRLP